MQAPDPSQTNPPETALNGCSQPELLSTPVVPAPVPAPALPDNQASDPLTGLPTQSLLSKALHKHLLLSRKHAVTTSLALLQLANFYEIRTWVGRSEADLLLSDVARQLQQAVPESATLYRCEHYEFALLLENECSLNAGAVIDRIRAALQSASSERLPPQLEMDCSVGLAQVHRSIPSVQVLFARARHDLHQTRQQPTQPQDAFGYLYQAPARTIKLIKAALAQQQLALNFQAVVYLHEPAACHYEVRATLPLAHEPIPARSLFELAAINALGETLDRQIIRLALDRLQHMAPDGSHLVVNLSLNSLVSDRFPAWLEGALAQYPQCRQRLLLQVSEMDCLIAQHHLGDFCESLWAMGVRLGIKHFGCMEDPLCYLARLKLDFVKLDSSATTATHSDSLRCTQLSGLVTTLHERGLQVIAGYLENIHHLPVLWRTNIDAVQGNALGAPGPETDFTFCQQHLLG